MQKRFESIITHERPHLDEIVGIWLLRKFGEEKFPGISAAEVTFWSIGGGIPDPDLRSAEDCERDGVLLIGVGGGRFDEHPIINGERKQDECVATLVAKAIGIDDDPSFEKILKFVANNDLRGVEQPFDLARLVKLLHQLYPDNPEKVMEWTMTGLEAKYREQSQFWNSTKQEFERTAEVEEIPGPRGKVLKMVSFASDDEQMSKFALSVSGGRAAIIIQKRSSGNVQIFTNKQFGLTLYDIAQMIRLVEQQAKGRVLTTEWKMLSSEGTVEGAEEWYFFHAGQMLLNGSLTAKNVPPTKLSIEQIKEIVRIGINRDAFEPKRASDCKQRVCTSTWNNPCPWYIWGLHRCRLVRFEMSQKK